ncbi:hypothetical protein R6Q59_009670 [Mikania micrantha]
MNKMSNKGKRGKFKCKKKFLLSGQFKIEFDKNGLAKGENKSFFMSWVGLQFRKKIPYHKVVKDIDPKLYDDIWEYTKYSKEKEMMIDGSYYEFGKDVVTEVVGKGRHHGGRTRLVSNVIGATHVLFSRKKMKSKKDHRSQEDIEVVQQNHYHVDVVSEASQEIKVIFFESIIGCELTWPFDNSCPNLVLARGRVYPTSQRTLHGCPILDGFVKVQVDFVNENCSKFPFLPQTRTDEVNEMADTQGQFIQWPRKAIKVYLIYIMNVYYFIYCYNKILIFLLYTALKHRFFTTITTYAEDVLVNQTNHIEDVARPQTTHTEYVSDPQTNHAKNIPAPKPSEILPDPKKIAPLLTLAKSRPQKIYRLAEKLAHVYAQTSTINVTSPNGMYMVDYHENVDVESMMQLCANGWVDVGVLHLYTMYLYAFGGFKGFHKTTYFNPRVVELGVCNTDPIFVIDYIKAVMEHHKDKQYFMAPYLSGSHWSLIMIHRNPKDNKFYGSIIDSINKGKSAHCYVIVDILQKAIGKSISWHMVKCYQQSETWECGYYVMKAMYDFVICCQEHLIVFLVLSGGQLHKEIEELKDVGFGDLQELKDVGFGTCRI